MPAKTYVKRPVKIEAIQFNGKADFAEVREFTEGKFILITEADRRGNSGWGPSITAAVHDRLHDTWVGVKDGQFIIKGIQGEFYPHDEALFPEVYDEVWA